MGKETFVEDLADGDRVDAAFSVKYRKPPREYKKGFFFVLGLADKTGECELKYWGGGDEDAVRRVFEAIEEGDVIRVKGKVSVYQDREQIDVEQGDGLIRQVEEYDITDFVPATENDVDAMEERLRKEVAAMDEGGYKRVMEAFLDDETFMEAYRRTPAAMYYHHAYLGGLLEHVLSLIELCKTLHQQYPALDLDLMKAGCFVHDIGKVREFDVSTNITQSEEGLLRGHIAIGQEILAERLAQVDIGEREAWKLHHIILAHHGSNEHGSPKEPAFPEAAAVYHADDMDSKLFQHLDMREDADTTDFHTYTERFGQLYLK